VNMKRKQVELTNTRVVCHIDMDCFYVQVERGINPSLKGRPVAVSQYNPFGDLKTVKPHESRVDISNGSLIAVSYEARAQGVKRNMRGAEAKTVCPDLVLVQVPTDHGKADLNIYRDAGAQIFSARFMSFFNMIIYLSALLTLTMIIRRSPSV
jgi:DNA polymerase eta